MTLTAALALLAATTAVVILLIARAPRPNTCHVTGCPRGASNHIRVHHPAGDVRLWACDGHAHERVYDQQLDGTDLGAWDQEMS